jgi:diguanylate cyclase
MTGSTPLSILSASLPAGGSWPMAVVLLAAVAAIAALVWQRRRGARLSSRLSRAREQIATLKGLDTLTGLVNRAQLEDALDELVLAADRGGPGVGVLYVGLDNFRTVNDGYGHRVGDLVLVEAAARLQALMGGRPVVSRIGGDEFALLVEAGAERATPAAEQALIELLRPYSADQLDLQLGASIGIAVYPEHGSRPRLVSHAALAMRSVKLAGGAGYAHFHASMGVDMREQAELAQDLRHAIEGKQLQLVYQPKIDARSLQVTAAEALLRWRHPRRGNISPAVFIPLAERQGLISQLGRWVIEEACRQAAVWREKGLRMRIAVNISGHQLRQDDLVDHLEAALRRHRVPAGRLTCEITESVAMEDTTTTRAAFERLRRAGLHVSIDDFGTGHSSLAALRRLPAAELKIDRAFVSDLASSEQARSIVAAVLKMAKTLGLRVVAEGVETEAQRDLLVEMGCDELQGYLFAKPMTAVALALWASNEGGPAGAPTFRPSLFDLTQPAELRPRDGA